MTCPAAKPGLVIRYSYLWYREHLEGREEGQKDRPCAIIAARRRGSRTASNSMVFPRFLLVLWDGWFGYAGTAARPALVRAMMVFMICAVPSPIWKPSTSRNRCSIRP